MFLLQSELETAAVESLCLFLEPLRDIVNAEGPCPVFMRGQRLYRAKRFGGACKAATTPGKQRKSYRTILFDGRNSA